MIYKACCMSGVLHVMGSDVVEISASLGENKRARFSHRSPYYGQAAII